MNWYKKSQIEDPYQGGHEAPTKQDSAPLYDLTVLYPDDIYSPNALRQYGYNEPGSEESINVIRSAHNKPNMSVKIYRAVPNLNSENEIKIKELYKLIFYHNKFNFFPINNKIIYQLIDKYDMEKNNITYDQQNKMIINDINNQIKQLETQLKPNLKINAGDWVTLSLTYAKQHGKSNLNNNYKILSKTVKAKDLYTYADSVNEWGYNP